MDTINMETYEQFHASEFCLNTLDKLKNYIKEQAKKTGNNRVGIFCATNLGLRSYVTRFVFNANDLNYYYHVQQTLGAGNPEFIGNVHTLSDPRLESLKIVTDNDRTTTYIETAEERLFQVGDFDGVFIKDCARSFSFKVTEIRNNVAYNFRFYPTSHGIDTQFDKLCNSHLVFITDQAARDYSYWASNDPESIKLQQEQDGMSDMIDKFIDDSYDDYDDLDDDQ